MEVVEFLGLPGAGKSTLMREVVATVDGTEASVVDLEAATLAAVRLHGVDRVARAVARSRFKPAWRYSYVRSTDRFTALTRSLAANPQVMEVVLVAQQLPQRRRGNSLKPESALNRIMNLMASSQLASEAEELFDWLLLDDGYCQRAIEVFRGQFNRDDEILLRRYVAAIVPAIVVPVEVSPSVCEVRLEERGWPVNTDRYEFLSSAARLVEHVAGEAERLGTRVVRVDGTAPIGESRDVLIRALGLPNCM